MSYITILAALPVRLFLHIAVSTELIQDSTAKVESV